MKSNTRLLCLVLSFSCLALFVFSGCQTPTQKATEPSIQYAKEIAFTRTAARELHPDGWLYSFIHHRMKDPSMESPDLIHYEFFAINLRYAFNMENVKEKIETIKDKRLRIRYVKALQSWGSENEAQRHDVDLLKNLILRQNATVDEMLSLKQEDFQFEDLDKDLFFRLMQEALTSDPLPEPSQIESLDKPTFAMLHEPEFLDGYKYQIAFVACMGAVEEIYIDVLYSDETRSNGYYQLSDLVENGHATDQQSALFLRIKECEALIRGKEQFGTFVKELTTGSIAGVNLKRLQTFLTDLDAGKYSQYNSNSIILSEEFID